MSIPKWFLWAGLAMFAAVAVVHGDVARFVLLVGGCTLIGLRLGAWIASK